MSEIIKILMERDGISKEEAKEQLRECRQMVANGADPEEVLLDELGLEPDYIFELI